MYILSIDVGNKTFGYCILSLTTYNTKTNRSGVIAHDALPFTLCAHDSSNIVGPDIKVQYGTLIERTAKLKIYLDGIDAILTKLSISSKNLAVIIEEQKKESEINRITAAQVLYHFTNKCDGIYKVSAVHKNNISFSPSITYAIFCAKYKSTQTAAKHHTTENFKYWLAKYGYISHVSTSMLSHCSDAFMQAYAYLLLNLP